MIIWQYWQLDILKYAKVHKYMTSLMDHMIWHGSYSYCTTFGGGEVESRPSAPNLILLFWFHANKSFKSLRYLNFIEWEGQLTNFIWLKCNQTYSTYVLFNLNLFCWLKYSHIQDFQPQISPNIDSIGTILFLSSALASSKMEWIDHQFPNCSLSMLVLLLVHPTHKSRPCWW